MTSMPTGENQKRSEDRSDRCGRAPGRPFAMPTRAEARSEMHPGSEREQQPEDFHGIERIAHREPHRSHLRGEAACREDRKENENIEKQSDDDQDGDRARVRLGRAQGERPVPGVRRDQAEGESDFVDDVVVGDIGGQCQNRPGQNRPFHRSANRARNRESK
jgi:hypothetical protein